MFSYVLVRIYRIRGVGSVELVKVVEECVMYLSDGSLRKCLVEYRKDPLTGLWCRINVERAFREHRPDIEEIRKNIEEVIKRTESDCPFCASRFRERTPRFYFLKESVLSRGAVVLVPNMFPFGKFHSIAILDPGRHYRPPWDLHEVILDLLVLCQEYFEKIIRVDSGQKYCYINMNFLFPAGSSAVHPHAQIVTARRPTNVHGVILRRAERYYRKTGRLLLLDYVDTEVSIGARHVLTKGRFVVYAPFAPHVNYEFHIVDRERGDFQDLSLCDIKILARILCNIISAVSLRFGQYSFNFSIYSALPSSRYSRYSTLLVRVGFRKEPYANYVNDIGFMELLHGEHVVVTYPEEYARSVRLTMTLG